MKPPAGLFLYSCMPAAAPVCRYEAGLACNLCSGLLLLQGFRWAPCEKIGQTIAIHDKVCLVEQAGGRREQEVSVPRGGRWRWAGQEPGGGSQNGSVRAVGGVFAEHTTRSAFRGAQRSMQLRLWHTTARAENSRRPLR